MTISFKRKPIIVAVAGASMLFTPILVSASNASNTITSSSTNYNGVTHYSSSNIRTSPGFGNNIFGQTPAGVKFYGTISNKWMHITSPQKYVGKYISTTVLNNIQASPIANTTPTATPKTYPALGTPYICTTRVDLSKSKDANCIKSVQYILGSWATRTNAYNSSSIPLSGTFDSSTINLLKKFQSFYQIKSTGQIDAGTWSKLEGNVRYTGANTMAQVMAKSPSKHNAFPSTVKLEDGRLMTVYRSAVSHYSPTGLKPTVAMYKTYSNDGGYSWTNPSLITIKGEYQFAISGLSVPTTGPLKGRPVAHLTDFIGVYSGAYNRNFVVGANDKTGDSWGPVVASEGPNMLANTAAPLLQISDTDFIEPSYDYPYGFGAGKAEYAKAIRYHYNGKVLQQISSSNIGIPSSAAMFTEPQLLKLKDGRIIALLRTDKTGQQSVIYRSYSTDDGKNWSTPTPIFNGSGAPRITLFKDGKIVALYRHQLASNKTQAGNMDAVYRVSSDSGKTWSAERSLGVHSTLEMAYGSVVETPNGKATFVFASEDLKEISNVVVVPNKTP